MIEVLVSTVILSIGLLGIAGLQVTGLRSNQSSFHRTLATYQAWDIAERMRANSAGVAGDAYQPGVVDASGPRSCVSDMTGCSSFQDVADHDMWAWLEAVSAELPAGTGSVCRDSDPATAACDANADGTPSELYAVRLTWTDNRRDNSQATVVTTFSP